ISHEYTCHIDRGGGVAHPEFARELCTFANFEDVLDGMLRDGTNVFRIYGIFNHGIAESLGERAPYPLEQPFGRRSDGGGWDLTHLEPAYLDRLEAVVRAAYCRRLVVELTLLDPWDGDFATSPFAGVLKSKADFLRPGNPAQAFQKTAVQAIVERLRR